MIGAVFVVFGLAATAGSLGGLLNHSRSLRILLIPLVGSVCALAVSFLFVLGVGPLWLVLGMFSAAVAASAIATTVMVFRKGKGT
jgi:hypothetical protein